MLRAATVVTLLEHRTVSVVLPNVRGVPTIAGCRNWSARLMG